MRLEHLYTTTLGYDQFLRMADRLLTGTVESAGDAGPGSGSNFPPHNIIKVDENRYLIEMAVAGFTKDDLDINVQENVLTIRSDRPIADKTVQPPVVYIHRGIGARKFTKSIQLAETVEVRGASLTNGILQIDLENVIPDHRKPRKVEIGTQRGLSRQSLLQE